ncbi:MAG: hypothetical protein K1X47_11535 [Cyclobacteriaceae bacterium]|nr:hypothetical protein [Cyclobacteriaceae bacterium]
MKLKFLNHFAILGALAVAASCSKDSTPIVCDQYFLAKASSSLATNNLYYNAAGQLSAIVSNVGNRIDLQYDAQQRLTHATDAATQESTVFHYNDLNQLISTVRTDGDHLVVDSLVLTYDAEGRLASRKTYKPADPKPKNFSQFFITYPNASGAVVSLYDLNTKTGDMLLTDVYTYTFDDKKLPYTAAYYQLFVSWGNMTFPHNAVSVHKKSVDQTTNVTLTYNSGGYPLVEGTTTFEYQCTAPRE